MPRGKGLEAGDWFVPAFLTAFPLRSNVSPDRLLEAVDLLRRSSEHPSGCPENAADNPAYVSLR